MSMTQRKPILSPMIGFNGIVLARRCSERPEFTGQPPDLIILKLTYSFRSRVFSTLSQSGVAGAEKIEPGHSPIFPAMSKDPNGLLSELKLPTFAKYSPLSFIVSLKAPRLRSRRFPHGHNLPP